MNDGYVHRLAGPGRHGPLHVPAIRLENITLCAIDDDAAAQPAEMDRPTAWYR